MVYIGAKEAVHSATSAQARSPALKITNETAMFDPTHLRAQAQLCFAIADLMSDPADADRVRMAAEQYVTRAEKSERERVGHEGVVAPPSRKARG